MSEQLLFEVPVQFVLQKKLDERDYLAKPTYQIVVRARLVEKGVARTYEEAIPLYNQSKYDPQSVLANFIQTFVPFSSERMRERG